MFETLTFLIIEIIPRSNISHGLLFIVWHGLGFSPFLFVFLGMCLVFVLFVFLCLVSGFLFLFCLFVLFLMGFFFEGCCCCCFVCLRLLEFVWVLLFFGVFFVLVFLGLCLFVVVFWGVLWGCCCCLFVCLFGGEGI